MENIYLDYAATTPVDPLVAQAMAPYFTEKFGNATSTHSFGREAQKALEESRQTLADAIGANPGEIIFNSGATEGANHVIFGLANQSKNKGGHIIISAIEHHCVIEPVEELEKQGFDITYLKVNENGIVDLDHLRSSIKDDTFLVAVMQANNEIGTIQPVEAIGTIAKERNILFFVDAVQAVGHIPVDVNAINADFLTLSAHKFYGPKGVGALYIKEGEKLPKFLFGGDQERGLRASTHNVAGAVGLAKAISLCLDDMAGEMRRQTELREKLIKGVLSKVEGVHLNGDPEHRLPKNAHFSFERISGESLLMSLDMKGFAASQGSACSSGAMAISHVLRAVQLDDTLADGSIRLTIGRWTTEEHIKKILEVLPNLVTSLRI